MNAYKIVHREFRLGSNASGFIFSVGYQDFLSIMRRHPRIRKLFPVYTKGSIIEEVPNTAGIMCFTSRKYAQIFIADQHYDSNIKQLKIIKVKGIGKKAHPEKKIFAGGIDIINFVHYKTNLIKRKFDTSAGFYPGAVAFKKVKVLQ